MESRLVLWRNLQYAPQLKGGREEGREGGRERGREGERTNVDKPIYNTTRALHADQSEEEEFANITEVSEAYMGTYR